LVAGVALSLDDGRAIAPRDIDWVGLRAMQPRYGATYSPGQIIFRQGENGHDFYVILEGEVEMAIKRADGKEERVAALGRGTFFGEMAVFRGQPRSATARALKPTSVLYFSTKTVTDLLVTSPRFALGIIQTLCDRIAADDGEIVRLRQEIDAYQRGDLERRLA
jgi:CRP-like cAMP-binding protein